MARSEIAEGFETSEPSKIARRFEEKVVKSTLHGLPSIIDGFDAVMGELPIHCASSLSLRLYRQLPELNLSTSYGNRVRLGKRTPYCIELRRDPSTGYNKTLLQVHMCKSLQVGFNHTDRAKCSVQVTQIGFKLAPVAAGTIGSVFEPSIGEVTSTEREISHLTTSASAILEKICDGVKFDEIAVVPNMLAEAVLRVVKPLTAPLKLEEVSLRVHIGDDPLPIKAFVSFASLARPKQKSRMPASHQRHVSLPHGCTSSVIQRTTWGNT